jgi:hypothetical protein
MYGCAKRISDRLAHSNVLIYLQYARSVDAREDRAFDDKGLSDGFDMMLGRLRGQFESFLWVTVPSRPADALSPVDDAIYRSKPLPRTIPSPRRRSHSPSTSHFPPTDFVGVNAVNLCPCSGSDTLHDAMMQTS